MCLQIRLFKQVKYQENFERTHYSLQRRIIVFCLFSSHDAHRVILFCYFWFDFLNDILCDERTKNILLAIILTKRITCEFPASTNYEENEKLQKYNIYVVMRATRGERRGVEALIGASHC